MQLQIYVCRYLSISSSNGKVYTYKIVGDLWQNSGFLQILWFPPPIKVTTTMTRNKQSQQYCCYTISYQYNNSCKRFECSTLIFCQLFSFLSFSFLFIAILIFFFLLNFFYFIFYQLILYSFVIILFFLIYVKMSYKSIFINPPKKYFLNEI